MTAPRACIIGHPIAYSRSPMLHGYWLRTLGLSGSYEPADVSPAEFGDFLRRLRANGFVGANVTVPHKEAAFAAVDRRDAAAATIGAVNTVWYEDDALVGGNTDAHGFIAHLDATAPDWRATRATVLGAGGAARAVLHALTIRGIEVALVNRSAARAHDLAAEFGPRVSGYDMAECPALLRDTDLLVNATSLGMTGKPELDLTLAGLKRSAIVYDIVYAPLETQLLRSAQAQGNRTVDGLGMLLHQAVPGFARWFGVTPEVTPELRALLETDIRAEPDLASRAAGC